jgi:hypothetical protein
MSLSLFMKKNKKAKENVYFAATKSLLDDKGKPLMWEIKPLSTKEDEKIRDACTIEVPIAGKAHMYRAKVNVNQYMTQLLVAAIVSPDLYNAELQDSYGVKTPEDLLKEMVNEPAEYTALTMFVQEVSGFNISQDDKTDEAKN